MEENNQENNQEKTKVKEEKKVIKISLTKFIIILAIIAIVVGIVVFVLTNNTKKQDGKETKPQENNATVANNTMAENEIQTNTTSGSSTTKYQISGMYYRENAEGDEPAYNFLENDKVEYGALWMCYGTYSIDGNTIKIKFERAVDPDREKTVALSSLGVKPEIELTIVNSNKLKDESSKEVFIKNKAPAAIQKEEIKKIVLEGTYGMPDSDGIWAFTKDGKAASAGNVQVDIGTYATTGKDTIEIHYTKRKIIGDNGEQTISTINIDESATIESNNIYIRGTKLNKLEQDPQIYFEETKQTTSSNSDSTDKIAKELFEKGSVKIRETEYTDYSQYELANPNVTKVINGKNYRKTKVLYSEVEKEYAKIFTGELLKKVMHKRFAEVDGYLYVSVGGATGWNISNIRVTKVSESGNEIKYSVKYCDDNEGTLSEEKSCNMTIKLVDGEYRILDTDYYFI